MKWLSISVNRNATVRTKGTKPLGAERQQLCFIPDVVENKPNLRQMRVLVLFLGDTSQDVFYFRIYSSFLNINDLSFTALPGRVQISGTFYSCWPKSWETCALRWQSINVKWGNVVTFNYTMSYLLDRKTCIRDQINIRSLLFSKELK